MPDQIQMLDFHGYSMERRDGGGLTRLLVSPKGSPALDAEGRPRWYWKVHFWGAFPFVDLALLRLGWHVAHTTVDELYGGPECMRRMDALHDEMVARGFSPHPVLCGMSRGGLDTANWAVHRAGAPAAIVLDNPVLDLRSWPFCTGRWPLCAGRWPLCAGRWPLCTGRWPLCAERRTFCAACCPS